MQIRCLKAYYLVFGFISLVLIPLTPYLFGESFLWHPRNVPYEQMLSVIYVAMGLVMLLAARNPGAHKAFLDFLVLANLLHALIMAIYPENPHHLWGDVLLVGLIGVVPLFCYPWGLRNFLRYPAGEARSTSTR